MKETKKTTLAGGTAGAGFLCRLGRTGGLAAMAAAVIAGAATPASARDPLRAEFVANVPNQPLGAKAPNDGTNRLFVTSKLGQIWIIDLDTNTRLTTPFLDISSIVSTSSERGLLGLAFDPDFATNGYFFINYTNAGGNTVIARYQVSAGDPNVANPTAVNLLRIIQQDFSNHNGGDIAFGPDGMLYVGLGDGGNANDPNNRAQDPTSLLGKILRLDPDSPGTSYIPADNPFVNDPNTASEIYTLGMRNPWRLSFDRQTGDMYIADVGQDSREEIDFIPAGHPGGLNFGWDCREGFIASPGNNGGYGCDSGDPVLEDPIFDVRHSAGACSISGGYVYRGTELDGWDGAYFYGDYCANFIRSFVYNPSTGITDEVDLTAQLGGISNTAGVVAFAEDESGELYFMSIFTGNLYKIVSDTTSCGCACVLTGSEGLLYLNNFQDASDWTTSIQGASSGGWEAAVPVNDPEWPHGPIADSDGSGNAFVTDNRAGNSDVDGGSVTLMSPSIDFTRGGITICYDYMLRLSGDMGEDSMVVEVSSNGASGPWTALRSYATDGGLSWQADAITQSELDSAGVILTDDMRVRFVVTDADPQSIVEAGLDDFKIYTTNPFDDCNNNAIPDADEITMGLAQDCNSNGIPDICDIRAGLLEDCDGGPTGDASAGATFFNNNCVGCHAPNGTGASGPNIRNVDRLIIQARLTFEIFHPGGQFDGSTPTDYANLEAFLADGPSGDRPDGIADMCQSATLPDCDNDGEYDGCEFEAGTLVDADYDGLPDDCTAAPCPCDSDGSGVMDLNDYFDYLGVFFAQLDVGNPQPGSADFDGSGLVDLNDYFAFLGCLPDLAAQTPCP